jgi:hypothetical protein
MVKRNLDLEREAMQSMMLDEGVSAPVAGVNDERIQVETAIQISAAEQRMIETR